MVFKKLKLRSENMGKENEYSAESIQALEGMEHV
ncbi:MAG: hypothetical protein ACI9EV_002673, partial [Urechidicola sp.]